MPGGRTSVSTGSAEDASTALAGRIGEAVRRGDGFLPFADFMRMALYEPGLGYYAGGRRRFGRMPSGGSDFVTAPELSSSFGRVLAGQVRETLEASGTDVVYEFGAGSGALAGQLLDTLGERVRRYAIVELSAVLRSQQRETLVRFGDRVEWLDAWPEAMRGVVVGNEVLDAMPVELVHRGVDGWLERGVGIEADGRFAWRDRASALRPPHDPGFPPGSTTELHGAAEAFVATLASRLERGAALFVDYGFPEREYYHLDRSGGTLMCHRGHVADTDPLVDVGVKDITAHVDFTGIALAGQDAGLDVAGYASQGRFLLNAGIAPLLEAAGVRERVDALKLVHEHEMGELFKVIAFATRDVDLRLSGFASGDRTHTL